MKKILILTILFLVIGQFIAACASTTSSPTELPEATATEVPSITELPEIETLEAAVIQTATSLAKTVEASKPPQPSITPLPPISPPPNQTPLPTPTPTVSMINVTFKITGTAKAAGVDWECMDPMDHGSRYFKVPWEESRSCWNYPDGKIILRAIFYYYKYAYPMTSGTGTLTCEIYVDGELVDSDSETVEEIKGWPSADCSYQP